MISSWIFFFAAKRALFSYDAQKYVFIRYVVTAGIGKKIIAGKNNMRYAAMKSIYSKKSP